MADRVEVVDPASGATFTVAAGSVQAKLWGAKVDEPAQDQPDESDGAEVEPVKRKPGRPRKSD